MNASRRKSRALPSAALLHLQGKPWARIGEFVGQRNLSVTADIYTHVLVDEAELDYRRLLISKGSEKGTSGATGVRHVTGTIGL